MKKIWKEKNIFYFNFDTYVISRKYFSQKDAKEILFKDFEIYSDILDWNPAYARYKRFSEYEKIDFNLDLDFGYIIIFEKKPFCHPIWFLQK